MSYDNFTLKRVRQEFNLNIIENLGLFPTIAAVEISDYPRTNPNYNIPLAPVISTEKAQSALIIANVLLELKRQINDRMGLFSGINLAVDNDRDLNRFCDYLLSQSSE